MNYKELFNKTFKLISKPSKAWIDIKNNNMQNVVISFVYPMIGLCSFVTFLGVIIRNSANVLVLQEAMTKCCAVAISLFAGYFLSVFLVEQLGKLYLKSSFNKELMHQFVGYSMVVLFVLDMLRVIFPFPLLLGFIELYIVLVVFEGARILLNIDSSKITHFSIMASIVIAACPIVIIKVFNILSENLI